LGVGGCGLSEQEFLNAGCCIGLVDLTLTLKEVGDLIQENWDILIWQLIPEHIDELNASSLQLAEIIDFTLLKLRQHQILQVVP
jgi:hypothetical protein